MYRNCRYQEEKQTILYFKVWCSFRINSWPWPMEYNLWWHISNLWNFKEARSKVNQVIRKTKSWLEDRGLKPATEKTELILLTRKRIPLEIEITICDITLRKRYVVNYLGIRMDPKLISHLASEATRWNQSHFLTRKRIPLLIEIMIWGTTLQSRN